MLEKRELNMTHSSADWTNDTAGSGCTLKKERKQGNYFKLCEDGSQFCIKEKLPMIEMNACPRGDFFPKKNSKISLEIMCGSPAYR